MVWKSKSKSEPPKTVAQGLTDIYEAGKTPPSPPAPPTLLQKEREKLAAAHKVLTDLQMAEHNQQLVIGHIRENINLLETHTWFERLYMELRDQENPNPSTPFPIPQGFVETLAKAKDSGLITDQRNPGNGPV